MQYPIKVTRNLVLRPLLAAFGVRRASSSVELNGGMMSIRMGRWFNESVPIAEVASMAPSEWPLWGGYGVRLAPRDGVGVIASVEGVVHIGLKQPRRMSVVVVSRNAERLWISLEDRDGFLAALSAATGLPVSPPVGFWKDSRA